MAGGRPTKFRPEFVQQAEKLCKLGATDEALADFFEVNVRTVERWKDTEPEFCRALNQAKGDLDAQVERRLFDRAMGYEHPEVDIRVVNGDIVQTPIRKIYPPDTTAAIFWLKNRKPEQWRETKAVELTGAKGGPLDFRNLTDSQLAIIAAGGSA